MQARYAKSPSAEMLIEAGRERHGDSFPRCAAARLWDLCYAPHFVLTASSCLASVWQQTTQLIYVARLLPILDLLTLVFVRL
jgi:hypothetical protein